VSQGIGLRQAPPPGIIYGPTAGWLPPPPPHPIPICPIPFFDGHYLPPSGGWAFPAPVPAAAGAAAMPLLAPGTSLASSSEAVGRSESLGCGAGDRGAAHALSESSDMVADAGSGEGSCAGCGEMGGRSGGISMLGCCGSAGGSSAMGPAAWAWAESVRSLGARVIEGWERG
jgi:hypothetical protein